MIFHRLSLSTTLGLAAVIGFAVTGSAQVLLSTTEFAILGGTAISVGGPGPNSIVNGHVGLSPGATSNITGFPPALVSGLTLNGAPAAIIATGGVTSQARADLITAKNALYAMPIVPANILSNRDLGTLAPLGAGVYTFSGAAQQTGTVVLDANFQNGVAWVFNIATSLTTAANSAVTFINLGTNGGNDNGLYWNAGTAINIGDNNTIAGNYLAGTSISFTGSTSTLGNGGTRALALAGVSFAGPATLNPRGGPGGGDYDGGLMYNGLGQLVPNSGSSGSGGSGGSGPAPIPTTTIAPGSVEGGLGSFGGNVTNNGTLNPGLVSPGAPIGTLNVPGNYSQSSTGTLVIQLASPTSFDRLTVDGTAALAGTVRIETLDGFDPLGRSFTFLTAAGGVSGTFGTLSGSATTNRAAIAAKLAYAPTSVTVTFAQLPFAGFALTPNQVAIANAAQANAALTTTLNTLPLAADFPVALNALSPQGYQVWSDFAFARSTSLADRLLRDHWAVAGEDDYYFEAGQRRGHIRADADVGTSTYTSSSGLVGGNRTVAGDASAGIFYAFGKTTAGLGAPGSQTTVKEQTIGLRAGWASGPLFAEAMLTYGFNRYSATRPIQFNGTSAVATSATRGHQWTTGLTVGQRHTRGRATLSPFLGLLYSRWSANGFTEEGAGAFNATLGSQSARSLRSQAGLEGRLNIGFVQPHVRAAWLHEFSHDSRALNASFGGAPFAVATRRAPRDTALYSVGLDFVLGPAALLYTDVTTQSGGATRMVSEWQAGLSVRF
jgi:uncharacterized protein with beta-barrel porin domain